MGLVIDVYEIKSPVLFYAFKLSFSQALPFLSIIAENLFFHIFYELLRDINDLNNKSQLCKNSHVDDRDS
jgi:hypothetical protein